MTPIKEGCEKKANELYDQIKGKYEQMIKIAEEIYNLSCNYNDCHIIGLSAEIIEFGANSPERDFLNARARKYGIRKMS